MNDVDDLLHTQGQRWATTQPEPPSLNDAVRIAATHSPRRAHTAVAMTVVAVAAIAAVSLIQTLDAKQSENVGTSTGRSSAESSPSADVLRELTARARSTASANLDPQATAEAVKTTYSEAAGALIDGSTGPDAPGGTEVWVIQLHGDFTCMQCKTPTSDSTPTGAAIVLILDAQTYEAYYFTISDQPRDLTALGTSLQLPM